MNEKTNENTKLNKEINNQNGEIKNYKDKTVIIADTREQTPYKFNEDKTLTVFRALPVGDYSIGGFEYDVAVERKTLDDFVHSISKERGRFFTELQKLSQFDAACVVVEASMDDALNKKYTSNMHPKAVLGTAMSIITDFEIPVFFCGGRTMAMYFTEQFLIRWKLKMDEKHRGY